MADDGEPRGVDALVIGNRGYGGAHVILRSRPETIVPPAVLDQSHCHGPFLKKGHERGSLSVCARPLVLEEATVDDDHGRVVGRGRIGRKEEIHKPRRMTSYLSFWGGSMLAGSAHT